MNINEIKDKFREILEKKFLDSYPDTFVKCSTKDPYVYYNSNGCMYSWYIKLLNSFSPFSLSPKYTQTHEEVITNDHSCVERFLNDFESSTDWEKFIFQNICISF